VLESGIQFISVIEFVDDQILARERSLQGRPQSSDESPVRAVLRADR